MKRQDEKEEIVVMDGRMKMLCTRGDVALIRFFDVMLIMIPILVVGLLVYLAATGQLSH